MWRTPECGDNADCQLLYRTFGRGGLATETPASVLSTAVVKQEEPRAAANANGTFSVWREVAPTSVIRGRLAPRLGAAGPVLAVSPEGIMHSPRVAVNGAIYAVVWIDQNGDLGRVMLRRYDDTGNALDAQPVALSTSDVTGGLEIVPRGAGFQVVWLGVGNALRTINVARSGSAGPITSVAGATADPQRRYFAVTASGDTARAACRAQSHYGTARSGGSGASPAHRTSSRSRATTTRPARCTSWPDPLAKLSSLTVTPSGIAALYTRPDDSVGGARRAFVRVLTANSDSTRSRAVRH